MSVDNVLIECLPLAIDPLGIVGSPTSRWLTTMLSADSDIREQDTDRFSPGKNKGGMADFSAFSILSDIDRMNDRQTTGIYSYYY